MRQFANYDRLFFARQKKYHSARVVFSIILGFLFLVWSILAISFGGPPTH